MIPVARTSAKLFAAVTSLGLLAGCGRQPAQREHQQIRPVQSAAADTQEVDALVAATKRSPSLTDPKLAGPPIHVDPYPHSAGMSGPMPGMGKH